MEAEALQTAVRRLREVVAPAPPLAPADAELLRAFVALRETAAFEQIVRRHGPMVLGVCRRVLRDAADADDAFQATFLVLVRKAGSLHRPDRLAGWLHQVAHRTARKVRHLRMKRAQREGELFDVHAGEPPAEVVWRELRPIFDAELDRLPDRLRLPAVLCFLEGHSKAEAASALGWPVGTLSCRLQRARERLRARLTARGLTLSAGAFAAAMFESAGSAAVPGRLIESTLQSISNPAAMAGVRALADGVTQAMFLAKLKAVAAAVLVAGVVGTGTGVVLVPGSGPGEVVAGQPAKEGPAKEPPPVLPTKRTTADSAMDVHKAELLLLKERLAFEERMLAKGYMSAAQVEKTRLEVARAEAGLTKADSPQPADARRKALETTIQKLEEIVEQTRRGVEKGIVPLQELLNAEATLARYKLDVFDVDARPAAGRSKLSPARRAAMEAVIQKLEEIAARIKEGVKNGIVPHMELLNAQKTVLEYKFKLLEFDDSEVAEPPPIAFKDRGAEIARKESELARGEALLKQKVISQEEVRRLRIDLARLRAESATAAGDHPAAVKHRDAVVAELEGQAAALRMLVERKAAVRSEVRAIEVALAEARVEALRASVRRQLAEIVAVREEEVREVRTLHEAKVISAEEVRTVERALAEAKARLAAER